MYPIYVAIVFPSLTFHSVSLYDQPFSNSSSNQLYSPYGHIDTHWLTPNKVAQVATRLTLRTRHLSSDILYPPPLPLKVTLPTHTRLTYPHTDINGALVLAQILARVIFDKCKYTCAYHASIEGYLWTYKSWIIYSPVQCHSYFKL